MVDYDKTAFFTGRKIGLEDLLSDKYESVESSYATWVRFANIEDSDIVRNSYMSGYESAAIDDVIAESDTEISPEDLTIIAALANAFDNSGDAGLQKEASVLDELLLTIAAPKNAFAKIKQAYDSEIESLRAKYRAEALEEKYSGPREVLNELNSNTDMSDVVDKAVKQFRPMEAALSTRYSPDHPGLSLMRISDNIYQDPITGKIYDYKAGYTTDKGNEVPGGSVELQSQETFNQQYGSVFTTRESLLASRAEANSSDIKKEA